MFYHYSYFARLFQMNTFLNRQHSLHALMTCS